MADEYIHSDGVYAYAGKVNTTPTTVPTTPANTLAEDVPLRDYIPDEDGRSGDEDSTSEGMPELIDDSDSDNNSTNDTPIDDPDTYEIERARQFVEAMNSRDFRKFVTEVTSASVDCEINAAAEKTPSITNTLNTPEMKPLIDASIQQGPANNTTDTTNVVIPVEQPRRMCVIV